MGVKRMTLIKDLSTNDEFVGFYLLKELELKQTNTSPAKDYFDLVLCDASGQLPAKYWDVEETERDNFFSDDACQGSRNRSVISGKTAG